MHCNQKVSVTRTDFSLILFQYVIFLIRILNGTTINYNAMERVRTLYALYIVPSSVLLDLNSRIRIQLIIFSRAVASPI